MGNAAQEIRRGAQSIRTGNWLAGAGAFFALTALLDFAVAVFRSRRASDTWESPALLGLGLLLSLAAVALVALGLVLRSRGLGLARSTPACFLNPAEEEQVLLAIRGFENRTSGEIRVHLSGERPEDVLAAGRKAFEELGMTATADRCGVLFFVCTQERRFAVLGDQGIDSRVGAGFWDGVVARVGRHFAEGEFAAGLIAGIQQAGEALAAFFPPREGDVNELPDGISRK